MDSLSRVLLLYPLSTALDVRCHFGAPWEIDNAQVAPGVAPYHMIISGKAVLDAGPYKGLALRAGDIVVFPKGAAHRLHVTEQGAPVPGQEQPGEHPLKLLANGGGGPATDILCGEFRFDARGAAALLAAMPDVIVVNTRGREDFAGLRNLMTMLRLETETLRPGTSMVVSQLASALFALVMRAWLEQADAAPGLFTLLAERRLQAAVHGMLAAPGQPWTLEQMAQACNMSRATFARLFTRAAGAPPAAILLQTRMARAAQWLLEGARSVGEIAEAVGYQSEAAFNRAFKRCYAVGPGQYRRGATSSRPV